MPASFLRRDRANPCAPRRRFNTKEAAWAASKNVAERNNYLRLPEPCSKCNGWHLAGQRELRAAPNSSAPYQAKP